MYTTQEGLEHITVQMTYCNLETEEIKQFRQTYSLEELELWFRQLIRSYEKWAAFQIEWKNIRNDSIRKTEFPYT